MSCAPRSSRPRWVTSPAGRGVSCPQCGSPPRRAKAASRSNSRCAASRVAARSPGLSFPRRSPLLRARRPGRPTCPWPCPRATRPQDHVARCPLNRAAVSAAVRSSRLLSARWCAGLAQQPTDANRGVAHRPSRRPRARPRRRGSPSAPRPGSDRGSGQSRERPHNGSPRPRRRLRRPTRSCCSAPSRARPWT
jgi:hypothetical protein